MPLDPTISLSAGQNLPQVPNMLMNPMQMNLLMGLAGKMAAGRAMQSAIDPQTGMFSQEAFAAALKNNPAAAPYALEALNQGLDASRKQLDQQEARRKILQTTFASGLIDDRFNPNSPNSDPKYATKWATDQLTSLSKQGIISPQFGVSYISTLPTDDKGNFDLPALHMSMQQGLFQTLTPEQKQALATGQASTIDVGGNILPLWRQFNPRTQQWELTIGKEGVGKTATPSERMGNVPTGLVNTPKGPVATTETGAQRATEVGVSQPSGTGQTFTKPGPGEPQQTPIPQPIKPSSSLGTGQYQPTMAIARILMLPPEQRMEAARKAYPNMTQADKDALATWITRKQKQSAQ